MTEASRQEPLQAGGRTKDSTRDREAQHGDTGPPLQLKPPNIQNYCFICLKDRKQEGSTHFLRQCPQLPQKERELMAKVFDKTLQTRNQPRDRWPKKILGQTVNLRLMNTVEDFYDLDQTPDEEDQQIDHFEEDSESGLSTDYSSLLEESLKDQVKDHTPTSP